MSSATLIAVALGYLGLLFAVAGWADRRAARGRSVVANRWVYTLSIGVYCSAWTYFGSVGRAADGALAFLPIYLGPTVAMALAPFVLAKMVRVARRRRITSIADFLASRHGDSRALAAGVTLLALVGVVPYVALQLKAIAGAAALLAASAGEAAGAGGAARPFWADPTFHVAAVLAGFTVWFGARRLDASERHEGLVAAIAFESVVKLLAFLACGAFVVWGLFAGPADLFARARDAVPALPALLPATGGGAWFAMGLVSGLALWLLPRQFHVMVVENTDERHLRTAAWAFPAYLLAINVFVLPIAVAGALLFGGQGNAETFVLSLPLAGGAAGLALLVFVGGLAAASGMVIVEATAVATMVCNDLVLPALLRGRVAAPGANWAPRLLAVRRAVIVLLLAAGYAYHRIAGDAAALVSIGLVSFAAVAQCAPALLGGLFWKGGTKAGALAGLAAGSAIWAWTLLLPAVARSGWIDAAFLAAGPFGIAAFKPEALFGLAALDPFSHAVFVSLLANAALYVFVSLARPPSALEAARAAQFVDALRQPAGAAAARPWRGRADARSLEGLLARFVGPERAADAWAALSPAERADPARLVTCAETTLAGAIGGASARAMVATVVDEEPLSREEVLHLVDEAAEARQVAERLRALDRERDDFVASVSHELRTPLTSIRAVAELMRDDPGMDAEQRRRFLDIVVAEGERLSRLVNQVLDLAKLDAGAADWRSSAVHPADLAERAARTTAELFRERGAVLRLDVAPLLPVLHADPDRLLQVLLNLLGNALKFVPPGTGLVTLAIRPEPAPGASAGGSAGASAADAAAPHALVFTVDDNGPGIPVAERERVFEKFRQSGDERLRAGGTGLGLPIARRIVEHLGGRLWAAASPSGGARLRFTLPVAAPDGANRTNGDDAGAAPPPGPAAAPRRRQETKP